MKRRLQCIALALLLGSLGLSDSGGDSVVLRPPLDKVIVKSWVGICQEHPFGVYKLVIRKNGTGELFIHEGAPLRWEIESWHLKGGQVYFALAQNKNLATNLAIHAVMPVDGNCLTLRTRWGNQIDLPETTILLFPEQRITSALTDIERFITNAPPIKVAPANGSQTTRSATNSMSSVAGSRR